MYYTIPSSKFFSETNFLCFSRKNPHWKKFLFCEKWNLPALRLKILKKGFLIFQEIELFKKNFSEGKFPSSKIKKSPLWKKFSYFRKRNILARSLKNSDIFSKNKCSYISEETLKSQAWKRFLYFSYYSLNKFIIFFLVSFSNKFVQLIYTN